MKISVAVACVSVVALCMGHVAAEPAQRRSLQLRPSPENPVGWRGDGSGRYPDAEPPLHWGRAAKSVQELRCQAAKPKEGETGQPMQLGVVSQWLVLGPCDLPVDFPEDADLTTFVDSLFHDTHSLRPDVGEELAGQKWKPLTIGTSVINWSEVFNRDARKAHPPAAILAHSYVYSPAGGPIDIQLQSKVPLQCFVNGETVFVSPKSWTAGYYRGASKVLKKGWNSVLLKIKPKPKNDHWGQNSENWYSCISLFGAPGAEYETHNVAWISKIPVGGGVSTPIVVGDKIFVSSEWCSLSCFNKADGKLLWVRSPTYYDAATEEEKKAFPEVFQEVAPLAEKLRQIDQSLPTQTPSAENRLLLEKQIHKLMRKASPPNFDRAYSNGPRRAKYALPSLGEPGYASPTPVSDGQKVYVIFDTGVVAAYDLDGNQKWVTWTPLDSTEHGCVHSPAVAGDRLILCKFQLESLALDTKTGKEVWHHPWKKNAGLWRGSVVTMKAGNETLFVEPGARISRASDGKCVFEGYPTGGFVQVPTTLLAENLLFELSSHIDVPSRIYTLPMPPSESSPPQLAKKIRTDVPTGAYPITVNYYSASPLFHDGLIYCVGDLGVLTVLDPQKGEIVYRKLLDADVYQAHRGGMGSSPTLAGKYIYLFGGQGVTLVIEPGRTFKQVARNRMECCSYTGHGQEIMESCPVFEGKRLYYRGSENLYCIEEK